MTELYLIFLGIAVVLFGGIVAYSMRQQRGIEKPNKVDYVDPLLADLAAQKKANVVIEKHPPQINQYAENQHETTLVEKAQVEIAQAEKAEAEEAFRNSDIEQKPVVDTQFRAEVESSSEQVGAMQRSGGRVEPELSAGLAPQVPTVVTEQAAPAAGLTVGSAASNSARVDANSSIITELVARVKNSAPIEQQELLALFRLHDFKFHRKVHIYGLNQLTDLWRDIEYELPSARFVELGVAIQLADRDGAMSKKELHDFQQMALDFSDKFDSPFEFSMDIDEALAQAQILDQIGRRYDSMAVLNVVPRAKVGFRMADLESCARDLMMSTDKNGIFVKTKGQKQNLSVLYRLACTDGSGHFGISTGAMTPVHDLVIYMNVPAIAQPDKVFQDMVKDANNLATWLDGKVVDRNGRIMTQRLYSVLMQQISDIVYSMQQDGLTPGDMVSKKLF